MFKRYSSDASRDDRHSLPANRAFVTIAAADMVGHNKLLKDNPRKSFSLNLCVHRFHADTFHATEGSTDFCDDGNRTTTDSWTCPCALLEVDPVNILLDGRSVACVSIVNHTSDSDRFLGELAQMKGANFEGHAKIETLNDKYDIVSIVPESDQLRLEN